MVMIVAVVVLMMLVVGKVAVGLAGAIVLLMLYVTLLACRPYLSYVICWWLQLLLWW